MSKAILLSGGMDSIALAYWKRPSVAITIDYGQLPAIAEIRSSRIVAKSLNINHEVIKVDFSGLGSGDLAGQTSLGLSPSTDWWPYRNQMLVTIALMKAIKLGISEIMLASVKSDGFHKDGTKGFYDHLNNLSTYQEGNIAITSPCIDLTTAELINQSSVSKEILFWAHSCHRSNIPCCNCRGCNKYAQIMKELYYAE